MDDLDAATKTKVWDILHVFKPVQSLCPCYRNFTVAMHLNDVLSESDNHVNIMGATMNLDWCADTFCGFPIHENLCQCPVITKCGVKLPKWIWETTLNQSCADVILAGAMWDGDWISVLHTQSAVIPINKQSWQKECIGDSAPVTTFEMFSGGFGGWCHATKAIEKHGVPIHSVFALDQHQGCAQTFAKSHCFDGVVDDPVQYHPIIHEWNEQFLGHPKLMLNTAMENMWWLSIVGRFDISMWTLSPPCPPWSSVDRALGLHRSDGRNLLWSLMCVSLHRPPVILLENVSSLRQHRHWKIVVGMFKTIRYQIKWMQSLELMDVIPHKRDRLILVAVDVRCSVDVSLTCQSWPVAQKPTLRSYGVLMELNSFWKSQAFVTPDEMKMYLDPCNLPKDIKSTGHDKRSKRDVVKYRLRGLDDQASCILTSYGQPLSLFEPLVQRGGIYGCLILDGDQPRKLVIPEITMLFGLLDKCWLPLDVSSCMHYLGNAIAIPHALIALLNGLLFVDQGSKALPIHDTFAAIFGGHVTKHDVHIDFKDGGMWIFKGSQGDAMYDLTQPIARVSSVMIWTPIGSICIRCQFGSRLLECLKAVLGASMPSQIDIKCGVESSSRLPVPDQLICDSQVLNLHANVMSRMLLEEKPFMQFASSIVVVLTSFGPICLHRFDNMEVQDIIMALHSLYDDGDWSIFGLSNDIWKMRDPCPDVVFAIRRPLIGSVVPIGDCLGLAIPIEDALAWHGSKAQIDELIRIFRESAAIDFLECMGWHFTTSINDTDDLKMSLFMTPRPGHVHTPLETARMFLITRVFIASMPTIPGNHHVFRLRIKLWDTWIWNGMLDCKFIGDGIIQAWDRASIMVGFHITMRLVTNGQQANPDFEILQYQKADADRVSVFLIPMLHGGSGRSNAVSIDETSSHYSDSPPELSDPIALETTDMQAAVSFLLDDFLALDIDDRDFNLGTTQNFQVLHDSYKMVAQGTMPHLIGFMKYMAHSGIEKILDYIGWHFVLQFLDYGQPAKVRMLILPIPGRRHATVTLVGGFLHTALTIMAMPLPTLQSDHKIKVRVKIWNVWAYDELLDGDIPCHALIHSWEEVSRFLGAQLRMRMIAKGKRMNPDCLLKDYATLDSHGELNLKVFLVVELHGGGHPQPSSEQITKAKNAVASLLLDHGCDLQTVSTFTHKLVHTAGPVSIEQIMKQMDPSKRLQSIQTMADAMSLKCPEMNTAATQRDKNTQKKISKKTPVVDVPLNPADFQVKHGFFLNQDATVATQKESIRGSSTGFVLLDAEASKPWISTPQTISSDELAAVVIGKCPVENSKECTRVDLPVFNKCGQPLILGCCLHQLGSKNLKISSLKNGNIDIVDTSVLAFTVFKDEVEATVWNRMTKSPIRTIFEILHSIDVQLQLPVPPWGRSWRSVKGPSSPEQADSFQCHARVETKQRNDIMRIAGQVGLYVTPKDRQKNVDSDFGIIWLDMPLEQLKVTASTFPKGLGLVKVVKSKASKVSRGLRVSAVDFQDAYKHFKPSHDIPEVVNVTVVAKLSPTPVGASMDDIKKWLKQIGWKAKPMRPLKQDTWLLGFEERIEDQFVKWGDSTMLLTWLPDRKDFQKQVVIAGDVGKPSNHENKSDSQDGLSDPWLAYINRQKMQTGGEGQRPSLAPANPRSVDGPTESRFKKNEEHIDELRQSMQKISQRIQQQHENHNDLQSKVTVEFQAVRNEIAKSVADSTKAFEQTLDHSLRRQDSQFQSAFKELKAIIQASPIPAKKAKIAKPEDKDNDDEMDAGL